MKKTLYDILELSKSASPDAIGAAYARLKEHYAKQAQAGVPDANNALTAVREAYETLSNPAKRQYYDTSLAAGAPLSRNYAASDAPTEQSQSWTSLIIGGVVMLAVVGFSYKLYKDHRAAEQLRAQKVEQERLERQERLDLERQRLETARDLQQQQLDMQRRREEQQIGLRQSAEERQRTSFDRQTRSTDNRQQQSEEQRRAREAQQRAREEQLARDRERIDAERRAKADKELLRRTCLERYRRPDC